MFQVSTVILQFSVNYRRVILATLTYCTTRILRIYCVFPQYIRCIYWVFTSKTCFQQHFLARWMYILCIHFWSQEKTGLSLEIHLYTVDFSHILLHKKKYFVGFRMNFFGNHVFWHFMRVRSQSGHQDDVHGSLKSTTKI